MPGENRLDIRRRDERYVAGQGDHACDALRRQRIGRSPHRRSLAAVSVFDDQSRAVVPRQEGDVGIARHDDNAVEAAHARQRGEYVFDHGAE